MPTLRAEPRPDDPRRGWTLFDFGAAAALFLAVLAVFSPALQDDFVRWDDPAFILDNPNVHGVTPEHLRWMITAKHAGHFHPLTWLSWAIDYDLAGGLKPFVFHLTSILIHAANAVLVYVLFKRVLMLGFGSPQAKLHPGARRIALASLLGAALFAIHPLRAESVAWITERRDVLSTLFMLGSAIAYLRSAAPGEAILHSRAAYAASFALLVLSCLSKGWGMIFFVVLIVLDFYPLRRLPLDVRAWLRPPAMTVLLQKLPFMLLGVATALMAASASHSSAAVKTLAAWGIPERIVQACYGLWFYIRATVAPIDLSPMYQLPSRVDPLEPRFVIAYVFVGIAALVVVAACRRLPAVTAAGLAYAAILAPVLGVLQSGEQFVADRYSYLATMPVVVLAMAGLLAMAERVVPGPGASSAPPRRAARLLMVAVPCIAVASLGALTFAQCKVWRNTETLWSYAASVEPSSHAFNAYAMELERQGRKAEAEAAYRRATELNPTDGRAWFTYGNVMRDTGNLPEAEHAFQEAARYLPQAYLAYQNLGIMYAKHGHPAEALQAFRAAVADVEKGGRRPLSGGPYMTLAFALEDAGKQDEARQSLQKALAFEDTRAGAEQELRRLDAASRPKGP